MRVRATTATWMMMIPTTEARIRTGSELFVDAGVNVNKVRINLDPETPPYSTALQVDPHFGLGARRAVSANNDLGVQVELDEVASHALYGFRFLDYRRRYGDSFALDLGLGVDRYQLATPAYSMYGVIGGRVAKLLAVAAPEIRSGNRLSLRAERGARSRTSHRSRRHAAGQLLQDRERCLVSIAAILIAAILIEAIPIAAIAVARPSRAVGTVVSQLEASSDNRRDAAMTSFAHGASVGRTIRGRHRGAVGIETLRGPHRPVDRFEHERRVHQDRHGPAHAFPGSGRLGVAGPILPGDAGPQRLCRTPAPGRRRGRMVRFRTAGRGRIASLLSH